MSYVSQVPRFTQDWIGLQLRFDLAGGYIHIGTVNFITYTPNGVPVTIHLTAGHVLPWAAIAAVSPPLAEPPFPAGEVA